MKNTLIIAITALSLTLLGCGSTKNVAQEQAEVNQRNELFISAKTSVDKLTERLIQAKADNLVYFAKDLYQDALEEMEDVNDEFDDIRFSPQKTDESKATEIQSYVLKTNQLLDQAYLVKKNVNTTLAKTFEQITYLKANNADKLYPSSYRKFSERIDSMVEDIADGDIRDAQDDQAKLLPLLYALESKTVKYIKLSALQKSLSKLKKARIQRVAPISYQKAIAALQLAEAVINTNPRATDHIDTAVDKVKFDIAHAEHIVLEIKSLAAVNSKTRETYILKQENKLIALAKALAMADPSAKPISEQYNLIKIKIQSLQALQVQSLEGQLAYIAKLEQQLSTTTLASQQTLLLKDQELLAVNQQVQQLSLNVEKLKKSAFNAETVITAAVEVTEPMIKAAVTNLAIENNTDAAVQVSAQ